MMKKISTWRLCFRFALCWSYVFDHDARHTCDELCKCSLVENMWYANIVSSCLSGCHIELIIRIRNFLKSTYFRSDQKRYFAQWVIERQRKMTMGLWKKLYNNSGKHCMYPKFLIGSIAFMAIFIGCLSGSNITSDWRRWNINKTDSKHSNWCPSEHGHRSNNSCHRLIFFQINRNAHTFTHCEMREALKQRLQQNHWNDSNLKKK